MPSISSAGFGDIMIDGKKRTHPTLTLDALRAEIAHALVVSAWDLDQELLLDSEKLLSGGADTVFHEPRLLILDSGCYECRDIAVWSPEAHNSLLDRLPDPLAINIALVNFDLQEPYEAQIEAAQDQLGREDDRVKVCLLKPPEDKREHDLSALAAHVRALRFADVIGVAEKDLGEAFRERVRAVIQLRKLLDESGFEETPLHLFGSLDPVLSPLYFAAGADIFDGLTWLRYAYHDGIGSYSEAVSIIDGDLSRPTEARRLARRRKNLEFLRTLQDKMRILANTHDWGDLGALGERIEQVWKQASS